MLDLVRLAFATGAHLVLGWIYLVVSPLCLPRHPAIAAVKSNPFGTPAAGQNAEGRREKSEEGSRKTGA